MAEKPEVTIEVIRSRFNGGDLATKFRVVRLINLQLPILYSVMTQVELDDLLDDGMIDVVLVAEPVRTR